MARDLAVQLEVRLGESYHRFGQNQTTLVQTVGKNGAGWVMEMLFLLWSSPLVHPEVVLLSLFIKVGGKRLGGRDRLRGCWEEEGQMHMAGVGRGGVHQ